MPSSSTVSPGDSSWAANKDPIITIEAPKRIDLAISPWVLNPPSAIIGFLAALLQRFNAESCQPPVPNPVLILVIHTLPGPIPTFVASAPAFSSSLTPSGVPTFQLSQNYLVNVFICLIIFITEFE